MGSSHPFDREYQFGLGPFQQQVWHASVKYIDRYAFGDVETVPVSPSGIGGWVDLRFKAKPVRNRPDWLRGGEHKRETQNVARRLASGLDLALAFHAPFAVD